MAVAWSFDGKTLASAAAIVFIRLWNLSGKPLGELRGHSKTVSQLAWSLTVTCWPLAAADESVRLWRPDKGVQERDLPARRPVTALAFSPDSSMSTGGTTDEVIRLWDSLSGKPIQKDMRLGGQP